MAFEYDVDVGRIERLLEERQRARGMRTVDKEIVDLR